MPSNAPGSRLPLWARVADALTLVLAAAAAYVMAFGGVRVGDVFSMSTPWRALGGLVVVGGLRHYFIRTPPLHRRLPGVRMPRWPGFRLMQPRPALPETVGERRLQALHIVALWCLAIAQPVFDVVGRSPEFFIAHDARPADVAALLVVVCFGGPAACLLLMRLAALVGGPRWRRGAGTMIVATLAAVLALAALKPVSGEAGRYLVGLAALAGTGAAVVYRRFATVRMFATFLTPAAIVVPAVFLFSPGAARVLLPSGEVGALPDVEFETRPPVVLVVFDQFQLAALLDRGGNIDRDVFPHFAALADDATWFRNASGVGNLTTYALPAVLTGTYPAPGRLPVAADHPANLFTLLGGHYGMHVDEPLTDLCPATLCPPERAAFGVWITGVLRDLAIVYLTVVLPDDLAAPLPPVTQTWNDFAANAGTETFADRWRAARIDDRRDTVTRYIAEIDAESRPMLHFLHALLPHEPFMYLPTGQQFTFHRQSIGLRDGKWDEDTWVAALNYQRYLLQVGYVDTLLGSMLQRLRDLNIYDDALIIVTADHGASLRPGSLFRRPEASSFADVAAVPLFIKRPQQRQGKIVDTNVEVIDIVPTLAAELGIALPWVADGAHILDPAHEPRASKVMFVDGARRRVDAPGDLLPDLRQSAARKFEWFDSGDPWDVPTPDGRYDSLIGRAVGSLRSATAAEFDVVLDVHSLMQDVDPDADFVPVHITGAVAGVPEDAPPPTLAIAVNDRIAAVTQPYSFRVLGRREAWEAIINPSWLTPGHNALEVFEVRRDAGDGTVALAATAGETLASVWPNLILEEELQALGGQAAGFYGTEWTGTRPFRWTQGDARLRVPIDPQAVPAVLAVDVLLTGGPKQLAIAVDGCTLVDEIVSRRWSATFDLDGCPLAAPEVEIALLSETHVPSARDGRTLGVGVGLIELRGKASSP